MPDSFTTFGPISTTTYAFLVGAGILISLIYSVIRYRLRYAQPIGAVVDVCIAGLIGGIVMARTFHVLLNWRYFQANTGEITRLAAGGLNWHGAVIGTLLAVMIAARLRDVAVPYLLRGFALILPFIGFMAWWGCGANHCSYGAEVDNLSNYPSWLVWETSDIFNIVAPRYATQRLGMAFSAGLIALVILSHVIFSHRLERCRFGLTLILFSAGMFWIGSMRGDFAEIIAGLRADQWLDLGIIGVGVGLVMFSRRIPAA